MKVRRLLFANFHAVTVLVAAILLAGLLIPGVRAANAGSGAPAGYWTVSTTGTVDAFGGAARSGPNGGEQASLGTVGMAPTPDGHGYWLVSRTGGVSAFGTAGFFGSLGTAPLNRPIVGMAATADGRGYWLVASDGGIFAFGNASFEGSGVSSGASGEIVGISAVPVPLLPASAPTASTHTKTAPTISTAPTTAPTTTTSTSPSSTTSTSTTSTSTTSTVTIVPKATQTAAMLHSLKLINYYPANHAWSQMWTNWDRNAIDADFARIAALHANAVRIILQPSALGYPTPSATMLGNLASTVSVAASHGLKVQITLFDWFGNYTQLDQSTQWATAILSPYANSSNVSFVELQNEIDPTNVAAMTWARAELPVVQHLVGSVPVTVSVTGLDTPTVLGKLKTALGSSQPDFYDVHFYAAPGNALTILANDKAIAGALPLYIGETGKTTYPGSGQTQAQAEDAQDVYVRTVAWAAMTLGLPPPAVWTLRDFASGAIPSQSSLSLDPKQYNMGIVRLDGTSKPTVTALAQLFATGSVNTDLNYSLARGSGQQPADWIPFNGSQGTLTWTTLVSHSGGGSVSLSGTGGSQNLVPAYEVFPVQVPTHTGQLFRASVWAKGSGATGQNEISIAWFAANGTYLGNNYSASLPTGNTSWTNLSVTSAAPAGAAWESVHLSSYLNAGTVWFSDVSLAVG